MVGARLTQQYQCQLDYHHIRIKVGARLPTQVGRKSTVKQYTTCNLFLIFMLEKGNVFQPENITSTVKNLDPRPCVSQPKH